MASQLKRQRSARCLALTIVSAIVARLCDAASSDLFAGGECAVNDHIISARSQISVDGRRILQVTTKLEGLISTRLLPWPGPLLGSRKNDWPSALIGAERAARNLQRGDGLAGDLE